MRLTPALFVATLAAATTSMSAVAAERTVPVQDFTSFGTASIDATITVGGAPSLVLTGPADKLLLIVVEQKTGALNIKVKREKGAMWSGNYDMSGVMARVSVPRLGNVDVGGSGDVVVKGVNAKRFTMNVGGSGSITANDARADVYEGNIGGSGSVILSGTCASAAFSIGGSGNVKAKDLKCKKLDISVGGSGEVQAYASDVAETSIAGSGDVAVYGSPKSRTKSVAGSGDVTYP